MKARRFALTMNNWTEEKREALLQSPKFSYLILGEEVAPTTGTPHLQGYVECKGVERATTLGKKFHAAFFACNGTQEQNIAYCKKGGLFVEKGTPKPAPQSGGDIERERWARNIKLAEEGKLDELKEIDPAAYARCYSTFKQMKQDNMRPLPELDTLDNIWLWGAPGVGKSRTARDQAKELGLSTYPKPLNKWWDGYQNEDVVIIDDYEKDCHLDHHLKIWSDRYDFIAECKGGSLRIRPKHIFITSNYPPSDCFTGECLEAIKRRFRIIHLV